jgi:hypothetical protein
MNNNFDYSNDSYDIEFLHPKVWLFKNAFKHSKEIIDYFEKNHEWRKWEIFGTESKISTPEKTYSNFPTKEEWKNDIVDHVNNEYVTEFLWVFYNTTKLFCEKLDIKKDNWIFTTTEISKYYENMGVSNDGAMNFHTDHEQEKESEEGIKFGTACLVYLNDDYEGGEIVFRISDDSFSKVVDEFSYKPKTGDVLVFPSEHPFYHAVNAIKNKQKYLIRHWWRHWYQGSQEFIDLKNKFMLENNPEDWEKYLIDYRRSKRINIDTIINQLQK